MKWIISNERRPEKEGYYFCEDSVGEKTHCEFKNGHWLSYTGHPIAKWIDESPSTEVGQQGVDRNLTFEECLREEFLVNTQNYPKEYHQLFNDKFKRAEKRFASQPQEVWQDELWEEVINYCQDFVVSRSIGRNEIYEKLKSKFTLIKK